MRRRGNEEQEQEYAFRPEADSDEFEAATSRYGDPPTVTAPRGRANVVSIDFDDETRGRIDVDATPPRTVPFGDARADAREDREPHRGRGLDIAYEDLPSLEMRRPFDSYDSEVAERDAAAQLRAARESMRRFQSAHPAKPHDVPPSHDERAREASGPRQRPQEYAASVPSYDEDPSWDEPAIPPAPPVPREAQVPQNFVMGVQALRAPQAFPTPGHAYPPPHTPGYAMPAAQAMQGAPMQPMHAGQMQAMQGAPMQPMHAGQMQAMQGAPMQAMQPVHAGQMHPQMVGQMPIAPGTQAMGPMPHGYAHPHAPAAQSLQVPAQAAAPVRAGRFAWFFFGAVFGVCFAFFATGYFSPGGVAKKEDAFPPAPPPPVTVPVATIAAPPVVTAPPPPVVIAPPPSSVVIAPPPSSVVIAPPPTASAPPAFTPAPPPTYVSPAAPPVAHAKVVVASTSVASAPVASPAPRGQRVIARRPAPQGDDDAPAPAPKRPSADTGNLLSDALSP